ncbi:MAG: DEDD exonuclease domain-containing protein [Actinomycetota bacterium]|nr:DEDD exonuclease domain-containing protein [Actinomycetota bacterium]
MSTAGAPPLGCELYVQPTFDELGEPLRDVTFVVVDLETTGGSPAHSSITEIGAVKVRGGDVLGDFQTLVDPGAAIPPFITVLTGITDAMVVTSPRIEAALPAFLEFAAGSVLVAHNAPFDVGFLRAACVRMGVVWPGFAVIDTAVLARRVLSRDEVPNCKLSTLAPFFNARTPPCHRALADARATVDVLHGLLERLGPLGVQSLEELRSLGRQVAAERRRKRYLAQDLPSAPGVYVFRDSRGEPLYVGTSKDIRARVRSYFVSGEKRSRMTEMVGIAERVDPIFCAHDLEAQVRELRLIADCKPRYNRRSRFPERAVWIALTDEAFPRLSLVRRVRADRRTYLGPFGSRGTAQQAIDAVHEALPLRQCAARLARRPRGSACVLAEIGRCGAPCEGGQSVQEYAAVVDVFREAVTADVRPMIAPLLRRIEVLAAAERYEAAAALRDRTASFVRVCARLQRLRTLTELAELVAARPDGQGGWELALIRNGRLVAADRAPRGLHPVPRVEAMRATAETLLPGVGPLPAASAEESECILRWLERPGTRLVHVDGLLASPARGAAAMSRWLRTVEAARAADPFVDRRSLRTESRPARIGAA